jgi:hypothetical protein
MSRSSETARFPEDFAFQLTAEEFEELNRSQPATGSQKHRDRRFAPFFFTEHGAIQASNVLNSSRTVEMGVHVVRAFVRLREVLATNRELVAKLDHLERKLASHDQAIVGILDAIRQLMQSPQPSSRPIGFVTDKPDKKDPAGRSAKRS